MLDLLTDKKDAEYIKLEFMGANSCLYAQTVKNTSAENVDLIAIVDKEAKFEGTPLHVVYLIDNAYYDITGKIAEDKEELVKYIKNEFERNESSFYIANKFQTKDILFNYNGYDVDNYHQLKSHLEDLSKKRYEQYCDEESKAYKKLAHEVEKKIKAE